MKDGIICSNCGSYINNTLECQRCGYDYGKPPYGQLCAEPTDKASVLRSTLSHLIERYECFLGEYGYSDSAVREAKKILKECE